MAISTILLSLKIVSFFQMLDHQIWHSKFYLHDVGVAIFIFPFTMQSHALTTLD